MPSRARAAVFAAELGLEPGEQLVRLQRGCSNTTRRSARPDADGGAPETAAGVDGWRADLEPARGGDEAGRARAGAGGATADCSPTRTCGS